MEKFKKALDKMGIETRQSIDRLRAEMHEQYQEVGAALNAQQSAIDGQQSAIDEQQKAIHALQHATADLRTSNDALKKASVDSNRALMRQAHVLDQGLAAAAETWDRHRERVGTAVYAFVDDVNVLKTEVRGLSSRMDALERRNPPAA